MAWKGKYYYRNRRLDGQIVTEYVGSGYSARLAAQLDEQERQQAKQRRAALNELQKRDAVIDQQIGKIGATLNQVITVLLLLGGYHQHHRQWRKAKKNDRGSERRTRIGDQRTESTTEDHDQREA